ncbi:hypothetical protein Hanom_Chr06g00528981 [Helianthus anomalus]
MHVELFFFWDKGCNCYEEGSFETIGTIAVEICNVKCCSAIGGLIIGETVGSPNFICPYDQKVGALILTLGNDKYMEVSQSKGKKLILHVRLISALLEKHQANFPNDRPYSKPLVVNSISDRKREAGIITDERSSRQVEELRRSAYSWGIFDDDTQARVKSMRPPEYATWELFQESIYDQGSWQDAERSVNIGN